MTNLVDVLKIKFPDAVMPADFYCRENEEGKIEIASWNIEGVPKPTQKDIDKWISDAEILQEIADKQAGEKRQAAYPSIAELTLALWEKEVLQDDTKILELQAQREAVQIEFPKSTD